MKSKSNNNTINEVKEVISKIILIIQSTMNKNNFFPKTEYFINNKNEEKFPENVIFEKLFPNYTKYFKNLDYNFSKAIQNEKYIDENNNMSKVIRKYILDQTDNWNNEIVNFIGHYWYLLDKKIKYHTIIFSYMVEVFINRDKLSDYDKNILYWAILFHDVGKFHEMNTIYKEDYSKNKYIDQAHPFKSAIVIIQTVINKKLVFFNDENEQKEFIDFFNNSFTKAVYKSFEKTENKNNYLVYNINFKNFDDIEKFLLKLKLHKENKWIYEIMILINVSSKFA